MALIILVEDTPDQLTLMTQALEKAGFEVLPCRYYHQGYDAILTHHDNPALVAILSDYDLGTHRGNGQTVYGYARRMLRPLVPFIGSSWVMKPWYDFAQLGPNPHLHLIPKNDYGWDTDRVLAKLAELGITP